MGTLVKERPEKYCFSKNEIRYKFLTDNLVPDQLYLQVQLYARLYNTASFLNWKNEEFTGTLFLDSNLLIDVNGDRKVAAFFTSEGTLNLSAGDVVKVTQINYTAWVGTSPYFRMIIMEDTTELVNVTHTEGTINLAYEWEFTVLANRTYTVWTYTQHNAVLDIGTTPALPVINSFTLLKTFNLKPNRDGNTYLYIDAYIDSLLQWVLPATDTPYTNGSEQSCEFYISFRELSVITPDPDWIETEKTKIRIGLKGGIEKQKSSRNNYFLYQLANKSFFTWIPSQRFIYDDQFAWLSVLIRTAANYKIRLSIKLSNGDTVAHDIDVAFTAGVFYHINTSYAALGIQALVVGEQVHYYDVSLVNEAGDEVIYNPYRFYIQYRPVYEVFDLIYHNSLGGIDTERVRGEMQLGFDKEIQQIGGSMSNTGWSDVVKTGESSQFISKRDFYKGDVGFMPTKAYQEALQDLLLSASVYQWIDSRMVPILNLQQSVNFRKTTDKVFSLPIEWQLPFSNQVSTPKSIELGLGTDTETY